MNENLNLVEILKDCPKGTKLYSTVFGEVEFKCIGENALYPIIVKVNDENFESFTADGRMIIRFDGECALFPSREERDWSKFTSNKPKFDPKTLIPFDRVLQFDTLNAIWTCDFYSHKINEDVQYPYECIGAVSNRVIPYNEETKHLIGTSEEAPEFYRYWEE